jgi:F-type H+-transporting ATPase subunit a
MPEHTSFFSYLLSLFPALAHNLDNLGRIMPFPPFYKDERTDHVAGSHVAEPIVAAVFVVLVIILLALSVRSKVKDYAKSVIPDEKLTLRTFFELFIGYFYGLMKEMMGPKKAKQYFPLIGTCACFIFFSNMLGLIPGFLPPTATWSITVGCAVVVFIAFNYYGIKENGAAYFKHLMGPVWWLAPFIFVLEVFSTCLRPATLSIRLMLNITVDHILLTLALTAFPLLVPLPVMVLGTLVALVQVLVFCLLSSVYIALATEHEEHAEGHGKGEAHAH